VYYNDVRLKVIPEVCVRTRIKICGITNPADAELAARLGADAIGFNAYARSPRYISGADASAIVRLMPVFVETVAIFVNEWPTEQQISAYGTQAIQLHADHHTYTPRGVATCHRCRILAFPIENAPSLVAISALLDLHKQWGHMPAAILVDAHVPGQYGGTGQTAPWHLLADFKPGVPLILAGGLTPDNVAEAIRIVRPYAVDVASGVESSPGKKDPDKLRRFIDAVRNVSLPDNA
jgi:phosphoribosylanthranilate isomerase